MEKRLLGSAATPAAAMKDLVQRELRTRVSIQIATSSVSQDWSQIGTQEWQSPVCN
jgi:hypothetical protein